MNSVRLNDGRHLRTRAEKWSLLSEIRQVVKALAGKKPDPFDTRHEEQALRDVFYGTWDARVSYATHQLNQEMSKHFLGSMPTVDDLMSALNTWLNRRYFTTAFRMRSHGMLAGAFNLGKESVDAMYKKQTGHEPLKKDDVGVTTTSSIADHAALPFGVLFGLTEDHALQALVEQLSLAAGGFWDDDMSESVRKEMESWFEGGLTRDELQQNLQTLVNDRLSIDGKNSLPASYFDGLTEHYIVRARNIGSVYRGKALGAKEYKIVNPRDKRTSGICNTLSAPGMVFAFAGAESKVEDILGARSADALKQAAPFLTESNAKNEGSPVPPLHWRCRSWMQFIFE
jgi:hypothetical protein